MKAEFLRAAKFPNPEKADQFHHYSVGVHDVPEHVVRHPYFKMLLNDKLIVEPDAAKLAPAESQLERHKKMAEKVLAQNAKAEEPVGEKKVSEILDGVKQDSKKKKSKK